jgi:hypothetical protein
VSQHAVPTQVELAQQPMPGAPQREHAPTVHRKPGEQSVPVAAHVSLTGSQQSLALLHVEPVQHAWVVPPQTVHLPRTQATLLPPVHPVPPSVVQQGSPSPPHVVQLPFTQARGPASPVGLHSEAPAQHGCPLEPQVVHEPFAAGQTVTPASPVAQAPPLLTHVAVTGSQQPPGQLAFAQQSSPAAPHAVHEPFALGQNARPASLPAQAVPLVTHLAVTGSQQPPGQPASRARSRDADGGVPFAVGAAGHAVVGAGIAATGRARASPVTGAAREAGHPARVRSVAARVLGPVGGRVDRTVTGGHVGPGARVRRCHGRVDGARVDDGRPGVLAAVRERAVDEGPAVELSGAELSEVARARDEGGGDDRELRDDRSEAQAVHSDPRSPT